MDVTVPFARQRSCTNASPFVPCINKAAVHLERLRSTFSKWQLSLGTVQKTPDKRVESRDEDRKLSRSVLSSRISFSSVDSAREQAQLEIRGTASGTRVQSRLPTLAEDAVVKRSHLGESDVFDEVLELLGRLEEDRWDTEQQLEEEKERCEQLKGKLEELEEKRMQELPQAVQQEHDACAMDIAELQWHVAYQTRVQSRRQMAAKIAGKHNQKMKDDVDFLQEQCPQLEKKLSREEDVIGGIRKILNETLDELNQAQRMLLETEDKKAEAHGRASQERVHIERNLNRVRDNLREITDELHKVMRKRTANTQKIDGAHRQLTEDKQTCQTLDGRHRNCLQATTSAEERVNELKIILSQLTEEQKVIAAKNAGLSSDMESECDVLSSEQAEQESRVKDVKGKLKKTQAKNEQTNDDIHIMKQDIVRCYENAARDRKTSKRSEQDLVTLDQQLQVSVEEYQVVEKEHRKKLADLHQLEDTVQYTENSLQVTFDTLKSQLTQESHSKTLLQARIKADLNETTEFKVSSKKRLDTSSKRARDFEQQNSSLQTESDKLMAKFSDRQQVIEKLKKSLQDLHQKHKDTADRLGNRKDEVVSKDKALTVEVTRLCNESDAVDWKTDMLGKKVEDLTASMKIVERLEAEVSEVLGGLRKELDEKNSVIQASRQEELELRTELQEIKDYYHDVAKSHDDYVSERLAFESSLKEKMQKALLENQLLATEYSKQQSCHMRTKADLISALDRKLKLEGNFRDHAKLLSLQLLMQSTLDEYYRLRGVYNERCYTVCSARSSENGKRLESVETRFSCALEEIRRFLVGHTVGGFSQPEEIVQSATATQDFIDVLPTGKTLSSESRERTVNSSASFPAPVAISVVPNCA